MYTNGRFTGTADRDLRCTLNNSLGQIIGRYVSAEDAVRAETFYYRRGQDIGQSVARRSVRVGQDGHREFLDPILTTPR